MTILLSLAAICVVCTLILVIFDPPFEVEPFFSLVAMFCGIALAMAVIFIPMSHYATRGGIAAFHEVRETAQRMREKSSTWEAAAYQQEVADANKWLRRKQYYNSTIFDIWIPDDVEDLQPIE